MAHYQQELALTKPIDIEECFVEAGRTAREFLKSATSLQDFLKYHLIASTARLKPRIRDIQVPQMKGITLSLSVLSAKFFEEMALQDAQLIGELTERILAYRSKRESSQEDKILIAIKRIPGREEDNYCLLALFPPGSVVLNAIDEETFGTATRQPAVVFYRPQSCRKEIVNRLLGDKSEVVLSRPYVLPVETQYSPLAISGKVAFVLAGGFSTKEDFLEWRHYRLSDFTPFGKRFK